MIMYDNDILYCTINTEVSNKSNYCNYFLTLVEVLIFIFYYYDYRLRELYELFKTLRRF